MHPFFENRTIGLLGLEQDIWNRTPATEKQRYFTVWIFFFLYVLASVVSGVVMMYMLTSNWYWAFPLGIMLAFVLSNVFRFSLVILRRSVFDEQNPITQQKDQDTSVTTTVQEGFIGKFSNLFRVFLQFGKRKKKTQGEPGTLDQMGSVIRFCILTILSLVVIFPLAGLLQWQNLKAVNQAKRDSYLQQIKNDLTESASLQSDLLKKTIDQEKMELDKIGLINKESMMYQQKLLQIQKMEKEYAALQQTEQSEVDVWIAQKATKVEHQFFIVHSFKYLFNTFLFWFSALLISGIIWIPHYILYVLKSGKFEYTEHSTAFYKQIIESAYHETEVFKKQILMDKYGYDITITDAVPYWKNQPYCTVRNNPYSDRSPMSTAEFMDQIHSQSNPID
jgi:hypothetical protein